MPRPALMGPSGTFSLAGALGLLPRGLGPSLCVPSPLEITTPSSGLYDFTRDKSQETIPAFYPDSTKGGGVPLPASSSPLQAGGGGPHSRGAHENQYFSELPCLQEWWGMGVGLGMVREGSDLRGDGWWGRGEAGGGFSRGRTRPRPGTTQQREMRSPLPTLFIPTLPSPSCPAEGSLSP